MIGDGEPEEKPADTGAAERRRARTSFIPKNFLPARVGARPATGTSFAAIWRLAWPTVTNTLAFNMVQLWALKMVGPFGAGAIAAVSTGQRLTFLSQGVMIAIAAGAAAMVARQWGSGNREEVGQINVVALWLGLVFGLLAAAIIWVTAPAIAELFLQEPEAIAETILYLRVFAPWMVALSLNMIISTTMRACGEVLIPLFSAIVMAAVNIPLVYAWTQGAWGFEAHGVAGVAQAGGIALAAATVFMFLVWFVGRTPLPRPKIPQIFHQRTRMLLHLGWPAAAEQLALHGGLNLFVFIVGRYGTAPYAAYGIGVSIMALSFLVGLGFSLAGATLVGQALGAKKARLAFQHGWQTMFMAIACMTFLGALIMVFARQITVFMELDAEVAEMTILFLWFFGPMQPLMAIEFSLGGALRGAGDTRTPLAITLVALVVVRTGLAVLFLLLNLGVEWIFACLLADYGVKAYLYVRRFRSLSWLRIPIDAGMPAHK